VVEQVAELPPVLHPLCEARGGAAQLLCTLPLYQVAPAGYSTAQHTQHAACSDKQPQGHFGTCEPHVETTRRAWMCDRVIRNSEELALKPESCCLFKVFPHNGWVLWISSSSRMRLTDKD
jgi:hypothetical protein